MPTNFATNETNKWIRSSIFKCIKLHKPQMYGTEKCRSPPETQTRVPTSKLSTFPLSSLSIFAHLFLPKPSWYPHLSTFGSPLKRSIVSLPASQHVLSLYHIMSPVPQGRDPSACVFSWGWSPGTCGAVSPGALTGQCEELRPRARVFILLCVGEGEPFITSLNTAQLRSAFRAAQKIIASSHQHSLLLAHHSPSDVMPIERTKQETELVVKCYLKSVLMYSAVILHSAKRGRDSNIINHFRMEYREK